MGVRVVAAETLGLPFVPPYLSGRSAEDFACGANFAVGGATALSPDFFRDRGIDDMGDQVHLDMEMKWFRELLDLLCPGNLAGMYLPFFTSPPVPSSFDLTSLLTFAHSCNFFSLFLVGGWVGGWGGVVLAMRVDSGRCDLLATRW